MPKKTKVIPKEEKPKKEIKYQTNNKTDKKCTGRINTFKTINNSFFNNDNFTEAPQQKLVIKADPFYVSQEQYDEDPYKWYLRDESMKAIKEFYDANLSDYDDKISEGDFDTISKVFNSVFKFLIDRGGMLASEIMIVTCEFFELDYECVYNNILTPKQKLLILNDLKQTGHTVKTNGNTDALF